MDSFFLLIDWKKANINIWGGIAACLLQLIHDTEQELLHNYHVYQEGIRIFKSSTFFTFGIVFTMGFIFSQFIPTNKILKVAHVLFFSFGFLAFELLVVNNGMLEHVHYSYLLSLSDNILVMATIAWTKDFVISIQQLKGRKT